jgi:hypothetical protein
MATASENLRDRRRKRVSVNAAVPTVKEDVYPASNRTARVDEIQQQIRTVLAERRAQRSPSILPGSRSSLTSRLAILVSELEIFERRFACDRPITRQRFECYRSNCFEVELLCRKLGIDLGIEPSSDPNRPVVRTPHTLTDLEIQFGELSAEPWISSYICSKLPAISRAEVLKLKNARALERFEDIENGVEFDA